MPLHSDTDKSLVVLMIMLCNESKCDMDKD